MSEQERCFTIRELAERWRVSQSHVQTLIHSGRLAAFDIGTATRHQWRVTPGAVAEYEQRINEPQQKQRRRRKRAGKIFGPEGLKRA